MYVHTLTPYMMYTYYYFTRIVQTCYLIKAQASIILTMETFAFLCSCLCWTKPRQHFYQKYM